VDRRFYVTSVHRRKVLVIDSSGRAADFVAPGRDSLWGMLAVAVDPRRRVLWVTTAAIRAAEGYQAADSGRSALLEYDLRSGRLRRRLELAAGTGAHALGDMTLSPGGTVYVSDGLSGAVYRVRPSGNAFETVVPAGVLRSPQTPALAPDGHRLFVADYGRGVAIIDLTTRYVSWVEHPMNLTLGGVDGLYLVGRDLIAVQNGTTPNRVLRLRLDPALRRVERAEVLEGGPPMIDDPTHGVVVGHALYFIANSGWSRVRDDGSLVHGTPTDAPVVRKVMLR
jgi:hypothetical protein